MNILIIAPTPYFSDRGCHIRILNEVEALYNAGHTATIFTYHLGRNVGPAKMYRIKPVQWYNKTSAGPAWGKLYLDLKLFFLILKHTKKNNFDIIHAHLHEGAWIGWWVKLFLHKPLVLDAQGSLVAELDNAQFLKLPGLKTLFTWFERFITKRADHVFTSSPALLQYIQTYTQKCSLLPDGVNLKLFAQPDEATVQQLRTELQLNHNNPVIIYTGGFSQAKGIDYLIEAIPKILQAQPNTQFLLIGYPKEYALHHVEQLQLSSTAIKIAGQVNYFNLPNYLALGTIAVDPKLASSTESSGKMINYMAAGLPVVAFNTANAHETLNNTGVITTENTAASLATAIIELLNQPNRLTELGALAKTRVTTYYNWNTIIQSAIKIYEQLHQS